MLRATRRTNAQSLEMQKKNRSAQNPLADAQQNNSDAFVAVTTKPTGNKSYAQRTHTVPESYGF